jgi:hypothetical protein
LLGAALLLLASPLSLASAGGNKEPSTSAAACGAMCGSTVEALEAALPAALAAFVDAPLHEGPLPLPRDFPPPFLPPLPMVRFHDGGLTRDDKMDVQLWNKGLSIQATCRRKCSGSYRMKSTR